MARNLAIQFDPNDPLLQPRRLEVLQPRSRVPLRGAAGKREVTPPKAIDVRPVVTFEEAETMDIVPLTPPKAPSAKKSSSKRSPARRPPTGPSEGSTAVAPPQPTARTIAQPSAPPRRGRLPPADEDVLKKVPERLNLPMLSLSTYGPLLDPNRKLGEGGLGIVFRGQNAEGSYAIKTPRISAGYPAGQINNEDMNEIAAMVYLGRHPNVVQLIDVCWAEPYAGTSSTLSWYMVLEMASGDVWDLVTKRNLTVETKRYICLQMAIAVDYLAQMGVVHRDIKPANFLYFDYDDGSMAVKISDLGKNRNSRCSTTSMVPTGYTYSAGFAAPEILLGGPESATTDTWALGICFYFVMTGKLPIDWNAGADKSDYYSSSIEPTLRFVGQRPHETLKQIDTPRAKRWVLRLRKEAGEAVDVKDQIMNEIITYALRVDNRPTPERLLTAMCNALTKAGGPFGSNIVSQCSEALGMRYTLNCTQQLQACENFHPRAELDGPIEATLASLAISSTGKGRWRRTIGSMLGLLPKVTGKAWQRQGDCEHAASYFLRAMERMPALADPFSYPLVVRELRDDRTVPKYDKRTPLIAVGYDLVTCTVSDYIELLLPTYSGLTSVFMLHYAQVQLKSRRLQLGVAQLFETSSPVPAPQQAVAMVCCLLACTMTGIVFQERLPLDWIAIGNTLIAEDGVDDDLVNGSTFEQRKTAWAQLVAGGVD